MRPLFDSFEKFLSQQAAGFVPEIRDVAGETIILKGKYIRPTLVFASSGENAPTPDVVRRAAIVELTHLSTLVHDDVIDNAQMRCNAATANSKYGARTAILLGDMLFAHTMSLAFGDPDRTVSDCVAKCVRTICEGEIRQTLSDRLEILSRGRYYEMVYGKTAALFELSCRLGATAGTSPKGWASAAAYAGMQLGIAYQIFDDYCDWFMSESEAGKTLGTDLVSGKQTFPLIVYMEGLSRESAAEFAKNLSASDFEAVRNSIACERVLSGCRAEYLSRIDAAEKAIVGFGELSATLAKCCEVLRGLDFSV